MGRWDKDMRPDVEFFEEFRDLQLRLHHCKDKRKNALGREAVEKIDSETQNLYQEIRDLYVRNNDRFRGVYWDKATGFESFAWYLMLSDETRKRFR